MTKAQTVSEISTKVGITKKQVADVFDVLRDIIKRELGTKGVGVFEIPGIVRLKIRETEARKGVKFRNPATNEIVIRDVPKRRKIRATAVKALSEALSEVASS
ncbi:MAG: HU family DNA-binding protein [Sandaracinaceae bacterium]|nr:HU family DNA-binding protein [Sandaracinaceae bacterium]MDW8247585.1 HU family DNA-binding protein [Sandaracinaceae bacterium]